MYLGITVVGAARPPKRGERGSERRRFICSWIAIPGMSCTLVSNTRTTKRLSRDCGITHRNYKNLKETNT